MGFRNPVNTVSGDQITPGTITGSVFRTAALGNRVVIGAQFGQSYVHLYSGDPAETVGAALTAGIDTAGIVKTPWLRLASPLLTDMLGTEASVKLGGPPLNGFGPGSLNVSVPVTVAGDLTVMTATSPAGAHLPEMHLWGTGPIAQPVMVLFWGTVTVAADGTVGPFDLSPVMGAFYGVSGAGITTGIAVIPEVTNGAVATVRLRLWNNINQLLPGQSFSMALQFYGSK